ncbi:MAG: organic solute transporter Ostalpha-domain-containing protein [Podila humilis]|nr:MAG: organic solute transporter Ostalpha-domain-containing protein [Podila humilis]
MADQSNVTLAPNGCPLETNPVDPTHLFSKNGSINLDLPRIGWIGSGICAFAASVISFVLIWRHLQYYTKPNQQRYIVRMLLMVPIYAITSWFSFVYVREAVYYDSIRTLYEAFVIASFLILMLQYLGDSLEDQKRILRQHKKTERWFFPLCCLKYNPSRPHFLQFMKWGILQYVPLVVVATVLTIVLQYYGWYCESSWNPKFGHAWILVISTTAVTVATYFLIMFYFTIRVDLKEYEPFYKFLAVKLVVFFSFWQMVLIEGLVYFGYIHETTYWSTNDISVGINAVLIDVEMVLFAIMHMKAFSYKPYVPLIPNPAYVPPESESNNASAVGDNNTDGGNSRTGPSSYRRNSLRRNPSLTSLTSEQERPKRKAKSKSKTSEKDKEPTEPRMILDYTQKTPLWKGLLDSFNPLDTLRELGYGFQYLYRWSRGIPVDKDSRRLLDLEVAFGRLRPEVPYIPPKDKKKDKDKKKKDKKKKMGNDVDSDDNDSTEDSDDKEEDNDRDNSRKPRDPEKTEEGVEYHAGVGNSRSQDSLRNPRAQSKRITDVELGYGVNNVDTLPMHTMRGSAVTRKPIKPVAGTVGSKKPSPLGNKKNSKEYLGKEDATHTERATLPDIKLDPIPKKIFLSGLYEELPLPSDQTVSSTSSLDIPMPSAMPSAGTYKPTPYGNDPRQTRKHATEQEHYIPYERQGYTRPIEEYNHPEPSSSREVDGGLTQLSNRNFDTKTALYQQDFLDTVEPSETDSIMADSRDPRFGDNHSLNYQVSRDESIQSTVSGFYHNREGSRSDPELGRYGLDHEHYLEQMRFLAEEEENARFKLHQRELEGNDDAPDPVEQRNDEKPAHASQQPPASVQQKPQQHQQQPSSSRYPNEPEEQDPVIAEYNQLQYQQQQRQQQEQQQRHYQQSSSRRQPPPKRRNSLDSLDSDYSIGYRPEYRYDRNYNPVPVEPSRPRYAHQQQQQPERYQRSYRHPMPIPQPPPPQTYRFPDERDYLPPPRRDGYSVRGPPAAVSVAMRSQQYSRPYDDYNRSSQPYYHQPQYSYVQQARMDRSRGGMESPRYTSPPPQQGSSTRRGPDREREREWDQGSYRDQDQGPDQLFPASRYAAPFLRDYEYQQRETRRRMTQSPPIRHDSPGDRMGSRQQDPSRRSTPRNDGGMGSRERSPPPAQHVAPKARRPGPDYVNPMYASKPGLPPKAVVAGDAGSRARVYEDDGPYEEAVVWTRPPQ